LAEAPALEPPVSARQRTLAAMAEAAAPARRLRFGRAAAWIAVLGLGAVLGTLALSPDTKVAPTEANAPVEPDETFRTLARTSSELERALAEAPRPRQVMRASTAGTIVGLEDQIALIDAELARAAGEDLPGEYRILLMRDRVAVMSALVHVRYAQSYAFSY
jgi:hypothetical protein